MAQAVFDDGPMEEYLREAGEVPELMPGGSTVFTESDDPAFAADGWQEFGYVAKVAVVIQSAVSKLANRTPRFVERFKYDIISSSLLCDTLSTANVLRNPMSPTFPGNISSRDSSINDTATDLPTLAADSAPPSDYWMSSVALVVVALCIGGGYYVVASLAAGAALLTARLENMDLGNDRKPTLNALRDLIHASNVWDSVIQECFNILEKDERYGFTGPKNPLTPSSSLRVAVNTTIHTTQSQCDNVRQLFAALTTPSELSQLSEMYAPPSPEGKSPTEKRPLSLPSASPSPSKDDSRLSPTSRRDKRSTWNGTYSSLASAGSPTPQFLRRREKRRSDLFSLLSASTTPASSFSEPVTPATPATGSLFGVQEHDEKDIFDDSLDLSFDSDDSFGVAALDMQRNRQNAGYATVGARPMSSFYGSSKFTSIQPPRHPLSLSALQNSLQSALASKRYSCSHLLALRFDEDDEEGYWEDVRSVMSLLTSAFADAAARLTESLEEAERLRIKFENPSPESMPSHSRSTSLTGQQSRRRSRPISFAPMPSHMARFGAHVDAITTALNDARNNLEDCVDTLKAGSEPVGDVQEHPALQAYERLRKELGIALRECERGREKLLDIVSPPSGAEADDDEGQGEDMDDLPSLGSSGREHDQDQDQDNSSLEEMHQAPEHEPEVQVADEREEDVLPPPGIEQVYEGEPVTLPEWTRERSKMSREERIRAAREKREQQQQQVDTGKEKWGPTGEVVQELKDVIWKVGEKRRRLAIVPPPPHQPLLPPPQSPLPPIPTEHVLESGPEHFGVAL